MRVTRINPATTALFEGLFAAVAGFAVALLAWIGTGASFANSMDTVLRGLQWGMVPGLGALIVNTVAYFIGGYIVGYVHGALFNVVAGWNGSLEVATKDLGEKVRQAAPAQMATRRAEPTFGETIGNRDLDDRDR